MKTIESFRVRRHFLFDCTRSSLWIGFLLLTLSVPLHAAQFTANAVHTINGKQTLTERIHVADGLIRIEVPKGNAAKITILRPDLEVMLELNTIKQSYKELPYIPAASWTGMHQALKSVLAPKGEEIISGQVCDRLEAPGGVATFWISRELEFPIRTNMQGETVELQEIVKQAIDAAMFAPPPQYKVEFSIFAMQNGKPKFKPGDASQTGSPPALAPAIKGPQPRNESSEGKPVVLSALPEPGERLPDPNMRIRTLPSDGGQLPDPEHPLVVIFSQPVFADHFSFTIAPDPGNWKVDWDKYAKRATLHHGNPFENDQTYTLTVEVLGEADTTIRFTAQALDAAVRLPRDLERGVIDINQATRYRLHQLFNPGKVPEPYRRQKRGPSGTWDMLQIVRAYDRLDPETRKEITPYLLPPNNPDSAYYHQLHKRSGRTSDTSHFSLVANAWADDDNVIKAVHKTGTGYDVIVWGDKRVEQVVYKARDLIKDYQMYERFEQLMGRKTLDYGDHSLNIYIFPELNEEEEKIDGKTEYSEPAGLCWPDKYLASNMTPPDQRASTILISAGQCPTDRELGATLAHEIFHAFQFAFTLKAQKWLVEGSAVWAENFINPAWNTEQDYLDDTFNDRLKSIKPLTNESSDVNSYAMYLFPLYMTKVSPGYDDIIRRIWEGCIGGTNAVQATRSALGDFEAHWKTYALATLDEMPEEGQFPDIDNAHGDGPLMLAYRHQLTEFKIDKEGYGGAAFGLTHLGASYLKAINENQGPDAPAISFDLRRFHGNNRITVQAIIKYRDGRREHEDWSDMPERIFCLSHANQNFEEIYLVVACSEDKEREETAEIIDVVPAFDNDCYRGSVTLTWRMQGHKSMER
ncbi:MAG: hypothetical protein JSW39_14270, partial [Desulfobacterales bacterium]